MFIKNQQNANSNDLRIKKLIERNRTVSRRQQRKKLSTDQNQATGDTKSQFTALNSYNQTSTVISKHTPQQNPQLLMKRLDYINIKNDSQLGDESSFLNGHPQESSFSMRPEQKILSNLNKDQEYGTNTQLSNVRSRDKNYQTLNNLKSADLSKNLNVGEQEISQISKAALFDEFVSPKYEIKSKQSETDQSQINIFSKQMNSTRSKQIISTHGSKDQTIQQQDSINQKILSISAMTDINGGKVTPQPEAQYQTAIKVIEPSEDLKMSDFRSNGHNFKEIGNENRPKTQNQSRQKMNIQVTNKRQQRVNHDLEVRKFDTSTGFDPKSEMRKAVYGYGNYINQQAQDRSSYDNFDEMIQNLKQMDKNLKKFKGHQKNSERRDSSRTSNKATYETVANYSQHQPKIIRNLTTQPSIQIDQETRFKKRNFKMTIQDQNSSAGNYQTMASKDSPTNTEDNKSFSQLSKSFRSGANTTFQIYNSKQKSSNLQKRLKDKKISVSKYIQQQKGKDQPVFSHKVSVSGLRLDQELDMDKNNELLQETIDVSLVPGKNFLESQNEQTISFDLNRPSFDKRLMLDKKKKRAISTHPKSRDFGRNQTQIQTYQNSIQMLKVLDKKSQENLSGNYLTFTTQPDAGRKLLSNDYHDNKVKPKTLTLKAKINGQSEDKKGQEERGKQVFIGQLSQNQFKNCKSGQKLGFFLDKEGKTEATKELSASKRHSSAANVFKRRVSNVKTFNTQHQNCSLSKNVDIVEQEQAQPKQVKRKAKSVQRQRPTNSKPEAKKLMFQNDETSKADSQFSEKTFGYNYDAFSSIRQALHGENSERMRCTTFNIRKKKIFIKDLVDLAGSDPNSRKYQIVKKEGFVVVPNLDESSADKSSVEDVEQESPLKQDEELHEIFHRDKEQFLVNQQSTVQNGKILKILQKPELNLNENSDLDDPNHFHEQAEIMNSMNYETIRENQGNVQQQNSFMNIEEKYEKAKHTQEELFLTAGSKISYLIGIQHEVIQLEPQMPSPLIMNKLEAQFFRVNVLNKPSPLLLLINDHLTSRDREDYKVYWSLTETFPSIDASDGQFSSFDWIMQIPYFSNRIHTVFIGVYSQNSIKTQIACSYGIDSKKVLSTIFIAPPDPKAVGHSTDSESEEELVATDLDIRPKELAEIGINNKKIFTKKEKLKIFHYLQKKKVHTLMWNAFERNIFFNFVEQIQVQLAEKNKMNATQYTEKEKILIKQKTIFQSLGLQKLATQTQKQLNGGSPMQQLQFELKELDEETQNSYNFSTQNYDYEQDDLDQNKYEKALTVKTNVQPFLRQETYFGKQHIEKQEMFQKRETQNLENMKFKIFLTIKQQILRQIKEQKTDERYATLRTQKVIRTYTTHVKLLQIFMKIKRSMTELWDKTIFKYRIQLLKLRICMHSLAYLKHRFGLLKPCDGSHCSHEVVKTNDKIWSKIYVQKYIKPAFLFLAMASSQEPFDQMRPKKIMHWFLYEMKCRYYIKLQFIITQNTIISYQKEVRQFFGRIKLWQAATKVLLLEEKDRMIDAIKCSPSRMNYQWFIDELEEVEEETIKETALHLVRFIKNINCLDCYRHRTQNEGQCYEIETIEGAKKQIQNTADSLFGYIDPMFMDELLRYPPFIEKDVGATKNIQKKKKRKVANDAPSSKKKEAKAKMGKLVQVLRNMQKGSESISPAISGSIITAVKVEEIEDCYKECGIRMRIFNKNSEDPSIDIQDFINNMKAQPGQIILNELNGGGTNKVVCNAIVEDESGKDIKDNSWLRWCNQVKGIYEINMFREIIIYSLIAQKRINKSRDDGHEHHCC